MTVGIYCERPREMAERIREVLAKIDRKHRIDRILADGRVGAICNHLPRYRDGAPDLVVVFDSCVNEMETAHAQDLVGAFYQLVGVDTFYVTPTTWKFFKWQTSPQTTISFTSDS